ncbi:MAG: penicillin-binding transpeptidase domain-containing protein [Eubacteriales bacterium]|nr:penicillin-binding transpeptidase domain-containing protein [Eubacteriales bacterium]
MEKVQKLGFFWLACLGALVLRLSYISTIKSEEYSKSAVLQRTQKIEIKTVRGIIYDRNMIPLTEGESRLYAAVFPNETKNLGQVSLLVGKEISKKEDVQIFPLETVTDEQSKLINMPGVSLFNVSERYNAKGMLSHVIGYYSDKGGFGIENVFNKMLTVRESDSISMIQNANRQVMGGLGYNKKINSTYKGVKLTIDYHIQEAAEEIMDKMVPRGSVIVLDVGTGDILAMASRPNFKQSELAKYLDSSEGELINRAIVQYDIGSVFKVVLAAAALEEGMYGPNSVFECNGKLEIAGMNFVCNEEDGHGAITLSEGLAKSCNIVFYEIGQRIGVENIYKYAKQLGFGSKVLNIETLTEKRGYIPQSVASPREIANLSIGQGKIAVTPLQVADLFCTIANSGIRKQVSLVKGIVDGKGYSKDISPTERGRVLSVATARQIREMLEMAVKGGTGTRANINGWGAAGKTGSAETGWLAGGETMTHAWFAGYFPKENPKYVTVVMVENGKSGAIAAAPVFKEIGNAVKDLNRPVE